MDPTLSIPAMESNSLAIPAKTTSRCSDLMSGRRSWAPPEISVTRAAGTGEEARGLVFLPAGRDSDVFPMAAE
jgi:hypothetical protein